MPIDPDELLDETKNRRLNDVRKLISEITPQHEGTQNHMNPANLADAIIRLGDIVKELIVDVAYTTKQSVKAK